MEHLKCLDISNTIIVKGQKNGLTLEQAEKMAIEMAEEEAYSVEGQFRSWSVKNIKSFLIWLKVILGIIGTGFAIWLADFMNVPNPFV